jgi:hypothetical protein
MFKRDFFLTYGKEFTDGDIGESVNREDLKRALGEGVTKLLYLYINGTAYTADVAYLLNHWHLRTTNAEEKECYVFPIRKNGKDTKLLKRWE